MVLPPALSFLLGFNSDQFNTEIRASEYYGFFVVTLIGVGILFQIPVGVLAVTRLGIITPQQLAKNRRYAILIIAVVAMLLPGTDPITMLISMAPLYLLFEFSLLLARWLGRPDKSLMEAAEDVADDDDADDDEPEDADDEPGDEDFSTLPPR